jgi:putative DNA primase/helicase
MGKWYLWDGAVWLIDDTLSVYDKIRELCRAAAGKVPDKERKALQKAQTVASVERLTRSDRRHAATVDQWDKNDWLLNTPGGVVNLKTGEIKEHNPFDYCTKITSVAPERGCVSWLKFLDEITASNDDLVSFLQRMTGYALTGSIKEHALFFLYGTGSNGKGTFLNIIHGILQEYAAVAGMDVFTESKHDRHPTELAALMGARLVIAQETDEGKQWAEAKIKALTGGDAITARFMRQDFFTFEPKFKLLIAGNHKPKLRNVDEAMMRRLHLVPFTVTIPAEKRDPDLAGKLSLEAAGILQWLIDGCVAYQREGLNPPKCVIDATAEYFSAEDLFQQWIEDECEAQNWGATKALYKSWCDYAEAAGEKPGNKNMLSERLQRAGYKLKMAPGGHRGYAGISAKNVSG